MRDMNAARSVRPITPDWAWGRDVVRGRDRRSENALVMGGLQGTDGRLLYHSHGHG